MPPSITRSLSAMPSLSLLLLLEHVEDAAQELAKGFHEFLKRNGAIVIIVHLLKHGAGQLFHVLEMLSKGLVNLLHPFFNIQIDQFLDQFLTLHVGRVCQSLEQGRSELLRVLDMVPRHLQSTTDQRDDFFFIQRATSVLVKLLEELAHQSGQVVFRLGF